VLVLILSTKTHVKDEEIVGFTNFDELAYITSRKLANERGEKTGSVLLWRKKGDEVFH
jgi:hypothetical protein